MFYCKNCGKEKGWPVDDYVASSIGKCEVCGAEVLCFDVPSKNLPDPDKKDVEAKKEEPKQESKRKPKKEEMTPQEAFQLISDWIKKYLGPTIPYQEPEEAEYVDIEDAVKSFQALFYLLLRDHVTVGAMNDLVKSIVNKGKPQFSDDILAAKADSLVRMLFRNNYEVTEIDASYEVR